MANEHNDKIQEVRPWMFRVEGEYFALILSILFLLLIGFVFSTIDIYILTFLVVGAIIYVQLHQAQYLGNAIRVHKKQFPKIYDIFQEYARRLGISRGSLYIKQDPYLEAYTLGITSCTLVITSGLIEHLSEKELNFVIGHELGHYSANHTKISTLVSPVGSNNIFSNFIFGFWNRKCEYSSDRCGLVLTKDIDSSVSALIKLAVGKDLFEQLDMDGYIDQIKVSGGTITSFSEMLSSHPLITNRIKRLLTFWRENFVLK